MIATFHLLTSPAPFPLGIAWTGAQSSFDKIMVVFQSDSAGSNTIFEGSLVGYLQYTSPSTGDFASTPCQVEAVIDDSETTGLSLSLVASLPGPIKLGENRNLSLWVQKPPGCHNTESAARTPSAWEHFYFLRGNYVA